MDLSSKSVAELNSMSKAAIIAAITADRTETTRTAYKYDARGPLLQVDETHDATGKLLSTRTVTWTYHKSGEIYEVLTVETDGAGKETALRLVRHDTPGAQPRVVDGK